MTSPGQEALREAARLESARIYGRVQREHRHDEVVDIVRDHVDRPAPASLLDAALAADWPTSRIMAEYGVDYDTVQRARKRRAA